MSEAQWPSLLRALWVSAGRAAVARALPLYLGVLIGASVLFEGSGVRPADVVRAAEESLGQRVLLYVAWIIVSLPALRALLTTPSGFFLRTLPVPRSRWIAVQSACVLIAQAPWAYLWLRGGGLGPGSAAIAAAVAAGVLVLSRLERPSEKLAAALLLAVLLTRPFWPLLLAVSAPAAALGLQRVWLRAPEPRAPSARGSIRGGPALALAASYALVLWRQARAQLLRALGLTLLALVAGYFAVHNTEPASGAELVALACALFAPALILGGASLVGPQLRVEAQLSWLLAVCGTAPSRARLARVAPLCAFAAGLAAAHGCALGALLQAPAPLVAGLVLAEVLAGTLLSPLLLRIGSWALRGDGSDSGRFIVGVGGLLLGAPLSLARFGPAALFGWAALAVLALWERAAQRFDSAPASG